MMAENYLLSSAYFPPVHYMAVVARAKEIQIEREENYIKQTYRNRCSILSANGPLVLSVPVFSGSSHKTPIKDIRIDYSKKWQQVHLRGLISSYKSSAYFEYFFDLVEKVILNNYKFLLDLNMASLETIMSITNINTSVSYTVVFKPVTDDALDFRYLISPKKKPKHKSSSAKPYYQGFSHRSGFIPDLSALDLIFNLGPDSYSYIISSGE